MFSEGMDPEKLAEEFKGYMCGEIELTDKCVKFIFPIDEMKTGFSFAYTYDGKLYVMDKEKKEEKEREVCSLKEALVELLVEKENSVELSDVLNGARNEGEEGIRTAQYYISAYNKMIDVFPQLGEHLNIEDLWRKQGIIPQSGEEHEVDM